MRPPSALAESTAMALFNEQLNRCRYHERTLTRPLAVDALSTDTVTLAILLKIIHFVVTAHSAALWEAFRIDTADFRVEDGQQTYLRRLHRMAAAIGCQDKDLIITADEMGDPRQPLVYKVTYVTHIIRSIIELHEQTAPHSKTPNAPTSLPKRFAPPPLARPTTPKGARPPSRPAVAPTAKSAPRGTTPNSDSSVSPSSGEVNKPGFCSVPFPLTPSPVSLGSADKTPERSPVHPAWRPASLTTPSLSPSPLPFSPLNWLLAIEAQPLTFQELLSLASHTTEFNPSNPLDALYTQSL
eukprot:NODE_2709_length_1114_cov_16.542047_g2586_i0.p1 GENE.NODE_2709_length_1114_cov_16.542047_g2586_i0~~NODE_2709_length_1114_cov_16.542047_g2586_i0.p1  ORF type:complete len:316 (-),score=48.56 NODE_2709_length_1114_cov_16.542047_g2586_i0:166-1059(-)